MRIFTVDMRSETFITERFWLEYETAIIKVGFHTFDIVGVSVQSGEDPYDGSLHNFVASELEIKSFPNGKRKLVKPESSNTSDKILVLIRCHTNSSYHELRFIGEVDERIEVDDYKQFLVMKPGDTLQLDRVVQEQEEPVQVADGRTAWGRKRTRIVEGKWVDKSIITETLYYDGTDLRSYRQASVTSATSEVTAPTAGQSEVQNQALDPVTVINDELDEAERELYKQRANASAMKILIQVVGALQKAENDCSTENRELIKKTLQRAKDASVKTGWGKEQSAVLELVSRKLTTLWNMIDEGAEFEVTEEDLSEQKSRFISGLIDRIHVALVETGFPDLTMNSMREQAAKAAEQSLFHLSADAELQALDGAG